MPYKVLPLSVLCENVLISRHRQLDDLSGTRYQLLRRVLMNCSVDHLLKLERTNPLLVLEDEDVWYHLLQEKFSQHRLEHHTSDPAKIKKFFKQQLDEFQFDYTKINLDNYIKFEELGNTKRFRLPSKLLYLKYQKDEEEKRNLTVANLKELANSKTLQKKQNQVVYLDEVISVPRTGGSFPGSKPQGPPRSKLFQKSRDEAKKRSEFFRNPHASPTRRAIPVRQHSTSIPPRLSPVTNHMSFIPQRPQSTSTPTSSTPLARSPSSPTKKSAVSSVFVPSKRRPQLLQPTAQRTYTTTHPLTTRTQRPLQGNPRVPTKSNCETVVDETPKGPPVKRIKIGDYIARKNR